jgi:uracil phosphoribosyltransferase
MLETKNVKVLDWKVKDVLISRLRDKNQSHKEFVRTTQRLSNLMWEWVFSNESDSFEVSKRETFLSEYTHYEIKGDKYAVISILRSAESLVHSVPLFEEEGVSFGKLLIQRNSANLSCPDIFYEKLPLGIEHKIVFVVDNMLGTGGSAILAIKILIETGIKESNIRFVNVIACEEGVANLMSKYPNIIVYTCQIDPILTESKYISPGLGDFGDRYYNTPHH